MPRTVLLFALLLGGCGGTTPASTGDLGSASDGGDVAAHLRDTRYCEVLAAMVKASSVHVDVYNTQGLDDCPEAAWMQLDTTQLQTQLAASMVLLNGPRYWMIDAFVTASLVDPTPVSFGGIAMRHAASIDLPLAQATMLGTAYTTQQIERKTTVRFDGGTSVFELVDPSGRIFEMQSYSVQKSAQTVADLSTLESRLSLPAGWQFRTRVLTSDLLVTAIDGVATVVQDDFANTYQLSQQ